MAQPGWIKLYRSTMQSWIFQDDVQSHFGAWMQLLLMANHETGKTCIRSQVYVVQRGQIITSLRKLSSRWRRSIKWVSNFLNLLENDEMIEQQREQYFTRVTICNYNKFQDKYLQEETQGEPRSGSRSASRSGSNIRSKEDNNKNKTKNIRQVCQESLPGLEEIQGEKRLPEGISSFNQQVDEVFEHWRLIMNKPRKTILNKKRKQKILDRLKEKYSAADLKRAIEGIKKSSYHMRNAYDDIELICRDAIHVDKYLKFYYNPPLEKGQGKTIQQSMEDAEETANRIKQAFNFDDTHTIEHTDKNKKGEDYDNERDTE